MIYFTKLLLACLSAIDPAIYLVAICLSLGTCLVAALWELEQARTRWLQRSRMKQILPDSREVLRKRRRDRVN